MFLRAVTISVVLVVAMFLPRIADSGVAQAAVCGDFDASQQVDVTDVVYLINFIFAGGSAPADAALGDVDCNNRVDITDAVFMINFIFASGSYPCLGPGCVTGVLLAGNEASSAVGATYAFGPIAAAPAEIADNGLLRSRLSVILHPDATVGEVNAALTLIGGLISWMAAGDLSATVMVPAVSDVAAADSLANLLLGTGAFLFVEPAYQSTAMLTTSGTSRDLPESGATGNEHNILMRMPAAWNVAALADEVNSEVVVHVPAYYASRNPHPQISSQRFVGSRGTFSTNALLGNVGYWLSGIVGADHDGNTATGVFPVPSGRLRIDSQLLGGMTYMEAASAISSRFPTGRFVLLSTDEFGAPPATSVINDKIPRFAAAIHWRIAARSRMNDFFHVVHSGNMGQLNSDLALAKYATPAAMAATLSTPWEMFAPGELSFVDSVALAFYWDYVSTNYPLIETKMNNVLIVGGSDQFGYETPNSGFGSYVRALETTVAGPCVTAGDINPPGCVGSGGEAIGRYTGSQAAAAQVAGLAAYLLALRPSLINTDLKEILQQSFDYSPTTGIIDGYLAVQRLDQSISNAPVRKVLLDIADGSGEGGTNGKFDEWDIVAFLEEFEFYENQRLNNGAAPDYSAFDLNGDGFTGGAQFVTRFDLDVVNPAVYGNVNLEIDSTMRTFNENLVSDLDILCYYANTALYEGDLTLRDSLMVNCPYCAPSPRDDGQCEQGFDLVLQFTQLFGRSCVKIKDLPQSCPVESTFVYRDSINFVPLNYVMPVRYEYDSPEGNPDSTAVHVGVNSSVVYDSVAQHATFDIETGVTYYGTAFTDSNFCTPMYYSNGVSTAYYTFDIGSGFEGTLTLDIRMELGLSGYTLFTSAFCSNRLIEVTPSGNVVRFIDSLRVNNANPVRQRDTDTTLQLPPGRYILIRNIGPAGSTLGSCAAVTAYVEGYLHGELQIAPSAMTFNKDRSRLAKQLLSEPITLEGNAAPRRDLRRR